MLDAIVHEHTDPDRGRQCSAGAVATITNRQQMSGMESYLYSQTGMGINETLSYQETRTQNCTINNTDTYVANRWGGAVQGSGDPNQTEYFNCSI